MRYEYAAAPGLSVSFQRYPYPPAGTVTALPDSRGALPLHETAPGRLLVPSPATEAFWVGLIAEPGAGVTRLSVLVATDTDTVDVATDLAVPPAFAIAGIPRADGTWWALALTAAAGPACRSLDVYVGPHGTAPAVRIEPVSPASFERSTGTRLPVPHGPPERRRLP